MDIRNIVKVKEQGGKLLVTTKSHGDILVSKDFKNRHYMTVVKWVKQGNVIEPEFTDEELLLIKKQELKQRVEKIYQESIQKPIEYNGNVFQADEKSQDILTKVITSASSDFEIDWLDIDNNLVHMTLNDLKGLANNILIRGQEEFVKKVELKKQIDDCSTIEELNSIIIGDNNE
jgi:hypothetical protein